MSTSNLNGTGAIEELEGLLAHHTGFSHALLTTSGTTALETAYATLEKVHKRRDAVLIAPSFTARETVAPHLQRGGRVDFADIDPETLCIAHKSVEDCLTTDAAGIVAVDLFGHPHNTKAIGRIVQANHLVYIADCAQSLGSRINGKPTAHSAHFAILSLNETKPLSAGEGGAILTDLREYHEGFIRETQHPMRQQREGVALMPFALNGRINPIGAQHALDNLDKSLRRITRRKREARVLIKLLNESGLTDPIRTKRHVVPNYWTVTAAWKDQPAPVSLTRLLQETELSPTLRDLPARPIHDLAKQHFPEQVRIPHPLTHTIDQARRRFAIHWETP